MSREKQIEEIARVLCGMNNDCNKCMFKKTNCYEYQEAENIYNAGYRKQSENETLEAIDKFRSALMDKFIDLCRGNDFNKINLLLIGETIDRTFDDTVAKMKGGAE